MFKKNRGFTLIELLVVIAIIGILSSVVLASLNSARNKGGDAAVQANLSGVRSQAEIVATSAASNSYAAVCADPIFDKGFDAAVAANGGTAGVCADTDTAWAAAVPLKSNPLLTFCVDSTGNATTTTTAAATEITADTDLVCDNS